MSLDAISRSGFAVAPPRPVASDAQPVPPAIATGPSAPPVASPRLRLDPALGVVVMEFRSGPGVPARSIPSEQELAAYRAAAISGALRPRARAPVPATE